ncbi:MAG: NAD(P)H-hydrate dehydratase [Bacillota bacterium]|nr:MAG: NAD(P)H-hydrate dehydratase [Bacillota bacterium]
MRLYTAEQMRVADRLAAEAGVPGLQLMENAGRAVADVAAVLLEMAGPSPSRPVVILCGRGNNGGDGLVAARLLTGRGLGVEVVLAEPPGAFTGEARENLDALMGLPGAPVRPRVYAADGEGRPAAPGREPVIGADELRTLLAGAALIIDALLGTGARGAPREPVAGMISVLLSVTGDGEASQVESPGPPVLAVDIPSGLDADSGRPAGPSVRARATVTLGGVKVGLALPEAREFSGSLYLGLIGIPAACLDEASRQGPAACEWLLPAGVARLLPPRPVAGHKGTFGHAWVAAGSPGFTGAAVLAGLGALRAGAGLVTVACPVECQSVVASSLPEALTRGLPQGSEGRVARAAARDLIGFASGPGAGRAGPRALVVGPGLGATAEVRNFVVDLIRSLGGRVPLVLDADALNALALDGPKAVTEVLSVAAPATRPGSGIILTPHPGEMARLTGLTVADVQSDRLGVALDRARAWGSVVVLKGAGTVTASPEGRAWVNATGNPGMATGGSGDVLAGAIGAFLAQGSSSVEAALLGVSSHGLAGDLAARDLGPRGLIASDIAHYLPRALAAMDARTELLAGYGPAIVDATSAARGDGAP